MKLSFRHPFPICFSLSYFQTSLWLGVDQGLQKNYQNLINMSKDFNFSDASLFTGNVHLKPHFNTQCVLRTPSRSVSRKQFFQYANHKNNLSFRHPLPTFCNCSYYRISCHKILPWIIVLFNKIHIWMIFNIIINNTCWSY